MPLPSLLALLDQGQAAAPQQPQPQPSPVPVEPSTSPTPIGQGVMDLTVADPSSKRVYQSPRTGGDRRAPGAYQRWQDLFNQRHQPGANQQKLGPLEHGAFAESFVREHPLLGPPSMLAAIPAYNAAKSMGLVEGWFEPSVDSLAEAYRGVGRGVAQNLWGFLGR